MGRAFFLAVIFCSLQNLSAMNAGFKDLAKGTVTITNGQVQIFKEVKRKEIVIIDGKEYSITRPSRLVFFRDIPMRAALELEPAEDGAGVYATQVKPFLEDQAKNELCGKNYSHLRTLGSLSELNDANKLNDPKVEGLDFFDLDKKPDQVVLSIRIKDADPQEPASEMKLSVSCTSYEISKVTN